MPDATAPGTRTVAHASARILPFPLPPHGIAGHGRRPARDIVAPDDSGIRWPLVMSARARLAARYYDRPSVRRRIAGAVLREIQPS